MLSAVEVEDLLQCSVPPVLQTVVPLVLVVVIPSVLSARVPLLKVDTLMEAKSVVVLVQLLQLLLQLLNDLLHLLLLLLVLQSLVDLLVLRDRLLKVQLQVNSALPILNGLDSHLLLVLGVFACEVNHHHSLVLDEVKETLLESIVGDGDLVLLSVEGFLFKEHSDTC